VFLITKSFVELSPTHSLALEVMVSGICGGRRYELCYGVTTSGLVDCTQYINRRVQKRAAKIHSLGLACARMKLSKLSASIVGADPRGIHDTSDMTCLYCHAIPNCINF